MEIVKSVAQIGAGAAGEVRLESQMGRKFKSRSTWEFVTRNFIRSLKESGGLNQKWYSRNVLKW